MIDHTGNQPPSEYLIRWAMDLGIWCVNMDTEKQLLDEVSVLIRRLRLSDDEQNAPAN